MVYLGILCIILVIYAVITPFFYLKALKYGMRLAETREKKAEMSKAPAFKTQAKHKELKLPPEMEKLQTILRNCEVYDGTSRGQVKIERKKA